PYMREDSSRNRRRARAGPLAYGVSQMERRLAVASQDDCCLFASPPNFAPRRFCNGDVPLLSRYGIRRVRRWVAIRAGWKMTAASRVVRRDSAISLPMLEVPGWWESHRLPKAIPVVQALKKMARVRLDCRKFVPPARQAMM